MLQPTLELQTLGGLSLRRNGAVIKGAGAQRGRIAILAVVALAGARGISRDLLLAFFWPESDSERARGALKQALYALRRDTGEQDLLLGTTDLRLNPAVVRCDAQEFMGACEARDFERAANLYTGAFLDGVHLRDALELERWTESERDRLAQFHCAALKSLAEQSAQRQDTRGATTWWRRLAAVDPLNAGVAVSLIEALAAAGDTAAALQHARAHTALIEKQLGLPADANVLAAAARVRANVASNGVATTQQTGQPGNAKLLSVDDAAPQTVSAAPLDIDPRSRPSRVARFAAQARRRAVVLIGSVIGVTAIPFLLSLRARPAEERILVEMFANQTGDSVADPVARMITEWVTQGLARAGLVEVIDSRSAGTAVRSLAGDTGQAARLKIARALGATAIVRGVVFRQGSDYRVDTRILQARDGTVILTTEPVVADVGQPLELTEVVRQRVLGAFASLSSPRFSAWVNATSAPPRYDAWLEFVGGLDALALNDHERAYQGFRHAVLLDTTFVQAMLFALDAGAPDADSAFFNALLAATVRRRAELTPFDQASLDRVLAIRRRDSESAYQAAHRMVEIAPWSADAAYLLATTALTINRFREAWEILHSVSASNTWLESAPYMRDTDRFAHHIAGDYQTELAEALRGAAKPGSGYFDCMNASRPLAALGEEARLDSLLRVCRSLPDALVEGSTYLNSGIELMEHGHPDAGRRMLERARSFYAAQNQTWPDAIRVIDWNLGNWKAVEASWQPQLARGPLPARGYSHLGVAAAHLGDTATAVEMQQRLKREWPNERHWRAMIPVALGRLDEAVELLREAQLHGYGVASNGHLQPGLRPLHGYPPFETLRRARD